MCSLLIRRSLGIPVSLSISLLLGYILMASFKLQRSSKRPFCWEILGLHLALPVDGAIVEARVDLTEAVSSLVSVSVRGKGGGMAGAASKKSHGLSSSVPLWFAPKNAVISSQNFLVSLLARATVRHYRISFHKRLVLASSSTNTQSKHTGWKGMIEFKIRKVELEVGDEAANSTGSHEVKHGK